MDGRLRAVAVLWTERVLGTVVVAGAVIGSAVFGVGPGSPGPGAPAAGAGPSVVARSGPPGPGTGPSDEGTTDAAPARSETAVWVWPTGTRVVSRPWEAPSDEYAAGHRGIDVRAPLGTVAVAVAAGTVSFAGPVGGRDVVSIDHGGGLVSTLDSVAPSVSVGDEVVQGDPVGTVAVGHCPAADPCVHLGARVDGQYVDPTPFLPEPEWPVLLPESAWPG